MLLLSHYYRIQNIHLILVGWSPLIFMFFIEFIYSQYLLNMKVIKHLKNETVEEKTKKYIARTPFITIIMLPVLTALSLILSYLQYQQNNYLYQIFIIIPVSEVILFIFMGLSDLRRQQQKGTIFIFLEYVIFASTVLLFNYTEQTLITLPDLVTTSIPIQFLIIIGLLDGLEKPSSRKYLFIEPFCLKGLVYPFFIIIILNLISLRVDVFNSLIIGVFCHVFALRRAIRRISQKLDQFVCNWASNLRFIRTLPLQYDNGTVSGLHTSNSIVLEQK